MTQWTPAIHLIATRLITKAEVETAIAKNDAWHLEYRISTFGYHVLSQYAGRDV